MSDKNKRLEEIEELLDEIKPYSGYLMDLLDRRTKIKEFRMYKYRTSEDGEKYYNEIVALKKISNILSFLLK